MGIINKTAPVQSGKVYSALNQAEIFVTYTGSDTSTAETYVDNSTKTISVEAKFYVIEVNALEGYISHEDYERITKSTSTKIAIKIDATTTMAGVNVLCSMSESTSEEDLEYVFYGPEDANGYAYVVKVKKEESAEQSHVFTATRELVARMSALTTEVTVGALPAGSTVEEGTKVADLLKTILTGTQPTTDWKFKYVESANPISGVPEAWDVEVVLPASVKTTGYTFNELAKFERGYFAFAFIKELGALQCIYQNSLHINILSLFNRTEVTIGDVQYYMYVIAEKAKLSTATSFKIMWNLDEE